MGNKFAFIVISVVLLILVGGCGPVQSGGDGILLPTSVGTSAASTTAPLALPTIIQDTATPAPLEIPDEPGEFFFDDFSNRNSGWEFAYEENIIWDYYQDGYRNSIYQNGLFSISYLDVDFSNVTLVVDVRMIGGQAHNAVGLACRNDGIESFYASVINGAGYYGIYRRVDGGDLEVIAGNEQSVVVNQDLALNLVEMSCVGDLVSLKVNGQLLAEVRDSALHSGDVGLFSSTLSAESADVLFDNFYLYLEE